ncbi:MAG: riboflavin biosynthesis protein RibF, partial [Muribaculaceae bacterium]|nr:riboflavin biosynthesis protein RibF [Muribaculaceae bacterium]
MSQVKGATIGMFDGVHLGHQYLISQLKEQCDEPLVVTFDNHPLWVIRPQREPHLLLTPREKEKVLRDIGVNPVMLHFDDTLRALTAEQFIDRLTRDHGIQRLVLGFDNRIGSDRCDITADRRLTHATGVEIIRATELPGNVKVNSSAIRKMLAEGDVAGASHLLGRPYTLHGTVDHGKQLGRRLGFPTANLHPDNADKLIPLNGVYAADAVTSDGHSYRAVVNIGSRPTVDRPEAPVTIEAHLDGFTGNLYDSDLTLQFLTRMRDEQRFPDLDTLRNAIQTDLTLARTLPH